MHAALAMAATLAALGAIFQAFPALCPCEPRLPRGEIQAMTCGARSNIRLFKASTSWSPPAGIRSARKYNTRYVFSFKKNSHLRSDTSSYPARDKNTHRANDLHRHFCSCLADGPPARWKAQTGLSLSACTHARAPTSRSGAETAKGGAPPNPTLIRPKCVLLLLLLYVAATAVVDVAAAEVSLVRAVAATAAVVLLLRYI